MIDGTCWTNIHSTTSCYSTSNKATCDTLLNVVIRK